MTNPESRRPAIRRRLLFSCGQLALDACMEQHPEASEQAQLRFTALLSKVLDQTARLVDTIETDKEDEFDDPQLKGEPMELSPRLDLGRDEDQTFDECARSLLLAMPGVHVDDDNNHTHYNFSVTTAHPEKNLRVTVRRYELNLDEDMSHLGELDPTGVRYSVAFGLDSK